MVEVARQNGAATMILRTQEIFKDCLESDSSPTGRES
jgi:hypothetical protein